MTEVRKLQYIGNQYLLNIPAEFVKYSQLQKGDYLEVNAIDKGIFGVRKIAEHTVPATEALLFSLEQEARYLSATLNGTGGEMESGKFAGMLARYSYVSAKLRRLKKKIMSRQVVKV